MYRTKNLPRLTESDILKQWARLCKALGAKISCTPRSLIDYAQRGLIPLPESGPGGRGNLKTYHPETAAEVFANTQLRSKDCSIDRLRELRSLAAKIETRSPLPVSLNQLHKDPALISAFKGKEIEAVFLAQWLKHKINALEVLYADEFQEDRKAMDSKLRKQKDDHDLERWDEIEFDELLSKKRHHLSGIILALTDDDNSDEWTSDLPAKRTK